MTTLNGSCRVAIQHGGWGYFSEVTLDVELSEQKRGCEVLFDEGIVEWRAGIAFGVAYAFEKASTSNPRIRGACVRVRGFRGHDVDTTEIVAAYAAAKAFEQAIGKPAAMSIELDPKRGLFMVPK